MDQKEKLLREHIIAKSGDGYVDSGEESDLSDKAAELGLAGKFDAILDEACLKDKAVREKTAEGLIGSYIKKTYGDKQFSQNDVVAIKNYARSLIPEGNKKPDEAETQLIAFVSDKLLKERIKKGSPIPLILFGLIAIGAIGYGVMVGTKKPETIIKEVNPSQKVLSSAEKKNVDGLILSMGAHIKEGKYTDPPEDSAKMDLDAILRLDSKLSYKKTEIESLISKVVNRYMKLAKTANDEGDFKAVKKWIGRAKLFYRESEIIREKEKEFGLVSKGEN